MQGEIKMLKKAHGPRRDTNEWRIRPNKKLHDQYVNGDTDSAVKQGDWNRLVM
jgi:hypothetical protein